MKKKFKPTPEQLANLDTLATYLENLPRHYRGFDIGTYFDAGYGSISPGEASEDGLLDKPCGSAACAIGHGPYAGIRLLPTDVHWNDYADRVFGTGDSNTDEGLFMFAFYQPNGAKRAAKRIRKVLADQAALVA